MTRQGVATEVAGDVPLPGADFADAYSVHVAVPVDALQAARRMVERLALALQASLLVRFAAPEVADAFCASRLAGDRGAAFGTLPGATNFDAIIERTTPQLG